VVKSELATFFEVFPNGTIWSNDDNGQGYDTVVLGGDNAMRINIDALQARLDQNSAVAQSLRDVGFSSAISLLSTYAGHASDLGPWLEFAEINRDRNLRLQYLAGLSANFYQEGTLYEELSVYRRYPEKLFEGSEASTQELRRTLKESKVKIEPGKG
jgi:spermidine synthase